MAAPRPDGNKRTEQFQQFLGWDKIQQTRIEMETAEKDHIRKETDPMTPDGGMLVTDSEQRMGRPLHHKDLQRKLRKINRNFHFETSLSDSTKIGIYLIVPSDSFQDVKKHRGNLVFITGMGAGLMPEFSIIECEVKGIPDPESSDGMKWVNSMAAEKRGWRTVLFNLLKWKLITSADLEKHFKISLGKDSDRWRQMVNTPIEVISQEQVNG